MTTKAQFSNWICFSIITIHWTFSLSHSPNASSVVHSSSPGSKNKQTKKRIFANWRDLCRF